MSELARAPSGPLSIHFHDNLRGLLPFQVCILVAGPWLVIQVPLEIQNQEFCPEIAKFVTFNLLDLILLLKI